MTFTSDKPIAGTCLLPDERSNGPAMGARKSLNSIQALRAIAAWIVVFHHYVQIFGESQFNRHVSSIITNYGAIGVDLFFVISGFVIYSSINGKDITPFRFAFQRITRIAPAYWVFTAVSAITIVFAPYIIPSAKFDFAFMIKSLLFIPAFNPSGLGIFPLLPIGWTLNFEMAFYLVFCCSLFLPRRMLFFSLVLGIYLIQSQSAKLSSEFSFYSMSTIYSFLIGVVLHLLYRTKLIEKITPLASILICLSSLYVISLRPSSPHDPIFWGIPCACIIACFISQEKYFTKRSFIRRLGDWSYSTYLCHPILIFFALFINKLYQTNAIVTFLTTCASIVLVSWLSFRFIETPPMKIARSKIYAIPTRTARS
jgi:peptidoglycan/LPS O-acetylase OafA/YrhL